MHDWLTALADWTRAGEPCVLVTVAATRGSTPREAGAKMLINATEIAGTIGGGHLEYKSIQFARELLGSQQADGVVLQRFPLGPTLGQCCGGVAKVLFESVKDIAPGWVETLLATAQLKQPLVLVSSVEDSTDKRVITRTTERPIDMPEQAFNTARRLLDSGNILLVEENESKLLFAPVRPNDFNITVFGAGHTGQAVVRVLATLPCNITWIDSRQEQFPDSIEDNVNVLCSHAPEYEVDAAPPGSYYLIMTHDHPLDLRISERVLQRNDFGYCGLIGSKSKRAKFEKRLKASGISTETLTRMICPIGIDGINGKQPVQIAVAVAAQLLQLREAGACDITETGQDTTTSECG